MSRRKPKGRALSGILLLDKPSGAGSNSVLQQVKYTYCANKAGHTGSLDPLATGLLPICFGEATKFSRYLLDADKAYDATIFLGAVSDTADADGEVTFVADASHLQYEQISDVVNSLQGEQWQTPPMYSALKHQGQRLYKLARQGVTVDVPERRINVFDIELLEHRVGVRFSGGVEQCVANGAHCGAEIDIRLTVTKGTYIRSLAEEIGRLLGVGGYISALRRTGVASFRIEQAVTLSQLEHCKPTECDRQFAIDNQFSQQPCVFEPLDARLISISDALPHLPQVTLNESTGFYLLRGNPVQVPGSPAAGQVKIMLASGDFAGVGEIDDCGRVAPKRLVAS